LQESKGENSTVSKEKLIDIFLILVVEPDLEWEFIDGSIAKSASAY
jgi:hypothetical protein